MAPDPCRQRVGVAVRRGRGWLAHRPGNGAGQDVGDRPPRHTSPAELLRAGPRAADLLESAIRPPDPATEGWDSVLASLAVLAVRAHDLEALASVLRCAGRFGLTDDPVLRAGVGYLCAQQGVDGAFGGQDAEGDSSRRSLTRGCVAALRWWL